MVDSDDDYDRKRRDKFRGERSDYRDVRRQAPGASGGPDDMRRGREDWADRGSGWDRGRGPPPPQRPIYDRLGSGPGGRTGGPHEFSPPHKRPRNDWDRYSQDSFASSGYGSTYDHGPPPPHPYSHPPPMNHRDRGDEHHMSSGGVSGHIGSSGSGSGSNLLSFKSWLSTQDDSISDQDALEKYAEYKQEYKRQQLNEFFMQHREEEWFKNKYHPDESTKRKDEQFQNLKKRVNIFMEFIEKKRFEGITLDAPHAEKLTKIMDWYVIRLEEGSDELAEKILSDEPPKAQQQQQPINKVTETNDQPKANSTENGIEKKEKRASESGSEGEAEGDGEVLDGENGKSPKKKTPIEALEDDLESKKVVEVEEKPKESTTKDDDDANANITDEDGEKEKTVGKKPRTVSGGSEHSIRSSVDEEEGTKDGKDKESKEKLKDSTVVEELPQLHRTASVFLRNLSPAVPKSEVEALCLKHNGFLRAALADPQPERRWYRRGWVTFKRDVNIKEICWQLNNVRLKDAELGAIVNRDLTRRVRTVNGITPHKIIVRNDIRLAAQVIQFLDSKWGLWDEDHSNENNKESFGVYSTNPVLKNITDYLIEEASAEEEELLGMSGGGAGSDGELDETKDKDKNNFIERDEELIEVLDRLVLYLRFVHSLDYYNHAEYPYEDEMPNRLGIMHGRGMPPASSVTLNELQEYNRNFEQKMSTFCQKTTLLTEEECKALGKKEEETEIEKFITSNTQELGKDKWLCPLSGKKFKGPEFVRKHILNKHAEKLEEVKKEVAFFNSYLRDPKRPRNPDARKEGSGASGVGGAGSYGAGSRVREPLIPDRGGMDPYGPPPSYPPYGGYGGGPPGGYSSYGGPPRHYAPHGYGYSAPRGRAGGYRGRGNERPIISYRDLDAPPDMDDF